MPVFSRPFASSRIPRIKHCCTILGPSRASAAGWELDMFNHIRELLAGFDIEKAEIAVFSPILRERYPQGFAVRRRHKPIDRRLAGRIEAVGITNGFFAGR